MMNMLKQLPLILVLFLTSCSATQKAAKVEPKQINEFYLVIPTNAHESVWRDELAKVLDGRTEYPLKMGRVDVLTKTETIEIDYIKKWHESIGQALHYSIAINKKPVIALISLSTNDIPKIEYIQSICDNLKIRLIILRRKNENN